MTECECNTHTSGVPIFSCEHFPCEDLFAENCPVHVKGRGGDPHSRRDFLALSF